MRSRPTPGFTLIELLVTVSIAAILAAVALPSFGEFIRRGQIRSAAESVQNALLLARAEAVRRNTRTTFTLGDQAGDASWTVVDASGAEIGRSRAGGEGSTQVTTAVTPAAATLVTFNGFGRVVSANASTLATIDFAASDTSNHMRVEVETPGGQVRMCDPQVTRAGDPRRCLQ